MVVIPTELLHLFRVQMRFILEQLDELSRRQSEVAASRDLLRENLLYHLTSVCCVCLQVGCSQPVLMFRATSRTCKALASQHVRYLSFSQRRNSVQASPQPNPSS